MKRARRKLKRTKNGSEDSSKGRPTSKTPSSTIQSGEYEAILKSPRAQKSRTSQSKGMDKHRPIQAKEKERELLRKRLAELESEEEEDPGTGQLGSRDKKALLSRPLKKRKEWSNRGAERSWETSLKRQMKQAAARVLAVDDGGFFGGSRDRGRDMRDFWESDKEEVSSDNSDDDTSEEERKEMARKKNKKKEARRIKKDIFKSGHYGDFDDCEFPKFDREAMEIRDAEFALNLQHEEYRGWSAQNAEDGMARAWYHEEEEEEINLGRGGERDQDNRGDLEQESSQEDQEGGDSSQEEDGGSDKDESSWQNDSRQGSGDSTKEEKEDESMEMEIREVDRLLKEDKPAIGNKKGKPVVGKETSSKGRSRVKEVMAEGLKGRESAPKRDKSVGTEKVDKEIPFAAGPPVNMGRIPKHAQQRVRNLKEVKKEEETPDLREKRRSSRSKVASPPLKEIKKEPASPPEVKKRGSMTVVDEIDLTMGSSTVGQDEGQRLGAGKLSALVDKLRAKVGEDADKTSILGAPGSMDLKGRQKVEVKQDEKKTWQERPDDFPPQDVIDGMEPFSEGENETDVLKRILKESKEMGKQAGGKSETSTAKARGPGPSGVGRGSRKRESPTTRGRGRDPRGRGEKGMAAASVGRGRKPAGSQEAKLNKDER